MNFWLVAINKRHQTWLVLLVSDASAQCCHLRWSMYSSTAYMYICICIYNVEGCVWGLSCSPDMNHRVFEVVL